MKTAHAKFCKSKAGYGHYTPKCPRCGELKAGKMQKLAAVNQIRTRPTPMVQFVAGSPPQIIHCCWLCGKNHPTADCPGADLALVGGGSGAAVVRNARHLG